VVLLENGFISVEISRESALIVTVQSKLTGERTPIVGDEIGFAFSTPDGRQVDWRASSSLGGSATLDLKRSHGKVEAVLSKQVESGVTARVVYSLQQDQFWIERRLSVGAAEMLFDRLDYGRASVPGSSINELKLGKFDAPRLISHGKGGIFAGVGWWFYEVQDGLYQNTKMNYQANGHFEAEPWYVGVFQPEAGEPYAGWFWYKTFLSERKLAYDKQRSYALWNARSGYAFLPISNPDLLNFVGTAKKIGLDGITTGEVRGLEKGAALAATNRVARQVIDKFASAGVSFGLHEGQVQGPNWATEDALQKKLQAIDTAHSQGIKNLTIDFFRVNDRFADHRRVATFFRHIRDKMEYTECHLGMAVYGPQFQREVLINHPTDLNDFDISRFSSDWATLVGFRHSRRKWQDRYEYLMPENGLFYFCTHYSNYPRRYLDPEPQQFLYLADAWRGLAYAFHDKFGFRDSVAAQSAFSTFYVFGFLDARVPSKDAEFARAYLKWVRDNTSMLSRARVCFESEDALVMSKIQDSRGGLFLLNYTPGGKQFALNLRGETVEIRQIYPVRGEVVRVRSGEPFQSSVPGERLAIFEVNDGFKGLPPENPSTSPIDIINWEQGGNGWTASFELPDARKALKRNRDETLPKRVVSADQVETEVVTTKNAGRSLGKLPREFLDAYGFEEDKYLRTWKVAPWAFADRVWLVWVPASAPKIGEPQPKVQINGRELAMHPRVRYNPATRLAHPEAWDVPMWFADVTEFCRFGGDNGLVVPGTDAQPAGSWFIAGTPK
jgi:hypothetical protein